MMRYRKTELLVAGASLGGCAAVLTALNAGHQVIWTEEYSTIGGQLVTQAVPPDENQWIEQGAAGARYSEFRTRVRTLCRKRYPLRAAAANAVFLNPGGGSVSALCAEPRDYETVLFEMISEALMRNPDARLEFFPQFRPQAAQYDGDRVKSILFQRVSSTSSSSSSSSSEAHASTVALPAWVRNDDPADALQVDAAFFLDATELGDLLPLCSAEYVCGAESRMDTGEPHALSGPPESDNVQAFTCCLALGCDRNGTEHVIERPKHYSFWREHIPSLSPAWSGPLLSFRYSRPFDLKATESFLGLPSGNEGQRMPGHGYDFWRYRQLRSTEVRADAVDEISLMNWPQNDYMLGNIIDREEAEIQKHIEEAKELSRCMLYYLQTEAPCPLPGGGERCGYPFLYGAESVTGQAFGLAEAPYIRESRRIRACFTVTENHVGVEARGSNASGAAEFYDSVGIGSYRIDLHPSANGRNYIDIASYPFQIPLRAMIPVRMENLIPACKNIGTTHISNGCYRLHPVEWNIGEAAGVLASELLLRSRGAAQYYSDSPERIGEIQNRLLREGARLSWKEFL